MIYEAGEEFAIGGSKVLRSSEHDDVTLVGAGVTLHACLKAAELLAAEGIQARVVDCYSVKPIDAATVSEAAAATSGRIVVAEDHHPEGGLGSAVTECLLSNGRTSLHIAHLAVRGHAGLGHRGRSSWRGPASTPTTSPPRGATRARRLSAGCAKDCVIQPGGSMCRVEQGVRIP